MTQMRIRDLISQLEAIAKEHGDDTLVSVSSECCGAGVQSIEVCPQVPSFKGENGQPAMLVWLNSYVTAGPGGRTDG